MNPIFTQFYNKDPKEVAELIIKIHDEETKVGPFSDRIRTWDKVAVDYEKLYERIIKQGSSLDLMGGMDIA